MKTKVNAKELNAKELERDGITVFCNGFLEVLYYVRVAENVWLPCARPFGCGRTETTTAQMLANMIKLEEEGFEIEIRIAEY